MPLAIKQIILANMNINLYSCTLTFRKVVRRQIWGEVLVLIPATSALHFWIKQWIIWKLVSNYQKWKWKWPTFWDTGYFNMNAFIRRKAAWRVNERQTDRYLYKNKILKSKAFYNSYAHCTEKSAKNICHYSTSAPKHRILKIVFRKAVINVRPEHTTDHINYFHSLSTP